VGLDLERPAFLQPVVIARQRLRPLVEHLQAVLGAADRLVDVDGGELRVGAGGQPAAPLQAGGLLGASSGLESRERKSWSVSAALRSWVFASALAASSFLPAVFLLRIDAQAAPRADQRILVGPGFLLDLEVLVRRFLPFLVQLEIRATLNGASSASGLSL